MSIRKFRAGRTTTAIVTDYVGEYGSIFWDESIGELRLSDGETPGGLPIMGGGIDGISADSVAKIITISAEWGITPASNLQQSLGDSTHRWKDIYLGDGTIYLGDIAIRIENGVLALPANTTIGGATIPIDISELTDTTNLLSHPTSLLDLGITDGSFGQVLTTNGNGQFTFSHAAGGNGQPTWTDYTTNWESEPIWVASIPQGEVYQYTFSDRVAYRLVPATSNVVDSFYQSFTNSTLSVLLAARGNL
jgi:hypothetical protein